MPRFHKFFQALESRKRYDKNDLKELLDSVDLPNITKKPSTRYAKIQNLLNTFHRKKLLDSLYTLNRKITLASRVTKVLIECHILKGKRIG